MGGWKLALADDIVRRDRRTGGAFALTDAHRVLAGVPRGKFTLLRRIVQGGAHFHRAGAPQFRRSADAETGGRRASFEVSHARFPSFLRKAGKGQPNAGDHRSAIGGFSKKGGDISPILPRFRRKSLPFSPTPCRPRADSPAIRTGAPPTVASRWGLIGNLCPAAAKNAT